MRRILARQCRCQPAVANSGPTGILDQGGFLDGSRSTVAFSTVGRPDGPTLRRWPPTREAAGLPARQPTHRTASRRPETIPGEIAQQWVLPGGAGGRGRTVRARPARALLSLGRMTPEGSLQTSIVFVPVAGHEPAWFGVAFVPRRAVWVVWVTLFGQDLTALAGWTSQSAAERTLDSYLGAAAIGQSTLVEEVERSRDGADCVSPGEFTQEERNDILASIARRAV